MKEKTKALKAAFPHTIPVLTGFLFLGIAYGILMNSKGYGVPWTLAFSLFVFAGASQYAAIPYLTSAFSPISAFVMALMINARHIFYGISLIDKYKNLGVLKPYCIFSLCDETFSITYSTKTPKGVDENLFIFFISLLNQSYWVIGSLIGASLGYMVSFNIAGLDFVLTALFLVIFLNQLEVKSNILPSVIGLVASIFSLLVFGPDNFILPAMGLILILLTIFRKNLEVKQNAN
ncbi:AzlC family ABC transporter permease [Peptoniphilus catoniae]|uniref:AzlC family ABC transporter permease n=1 Tax=Peptoniphilus catoniae TaxID=1660341 RepID=UPI0010FEEC50|nr:AzlC family ABC transporter permease [Peptoniphilus catoniae]